MYTYYETEGKGLKLWDNNNKFEEQAFKQLTNIAKMPFIHSHVAGMPDVHYGLGATVGSVIATKGAIIPAAVGVDIGCGMMATKTSLKASNLPDNLKSLRNKIERSVPTGFNQHKRNSSQGIVNAQHKWTMLYPTFSYIQSKHPKISHKSPMEQLGTLGGGNHFIEICLDEEDSVWVMLHSGSRGIGNTIGRYFIEKAKEEMEKYYILDILPDKDLAYLVEHSEIYDDYIHAVEFAQDYARINRHLMMEAVLRDLKKEVGEFEELDEAVNCHHNYISRENHFGSNVLVTRKGAVRARVGDLGIIPGSMGAESYIVEGKGNKDSFCSCSHGAGRKMSRAQARKQITQEDHIKAMEGVECRLDNGVIDESPAAYKDINTVMDAQKDLVSIKYKLKQILNIKG